MDVIDENSDVVPATSPPPSSSNSARAMRRRSSGGGANRKLRLDGTMTDEEICEILYNAKEQPQYTSISFDEVTFNADIAAQCVDLLRSFGRTWDRINLEFCEGYFDLVVLTALTLDCVRNIFLATDHANEEILDKFAGILRINKSLQSLWLLVPVTESTAAAMGECLKYNEYLNKLSFSGSNWSPRAAQSFVDNGLADNTVLKTLDISCCFMPDEEMGAICAALEGHETLEVIDISRNICRGETIKALANMLKNPDSKLTEIDLREQTVEENNEMDILPLAEALEENDSLEILKLSNNGLTDDQIIVLADGLRQNSSLQELDLQFNGITEKGLNYLTEALPEVSSLEVLLLGGNLFGEEGHNLLNKLEEDEGSIGTIRENEMEGSSANFHASYSESLARGELLM
jgi:hypothetical protein